MRHSEGEKKHRYFSIIKQQQLLLLLTIAISKQFNIEKMSQSQPKKYTYDVLDFVEGFLAAVVLFLA